MINPIKIWIFVFFIVLLSVSTIQASHVKASIDDDPMLGDKNAPVTIIEFSDYQCPFCGRF